MLNEEQTERISGKIVGGPFGRHLGLVTELAETDHAVVRLKAAPHIMNGGGIVHGGATAALIDTAATAAAWATDRATPETRGTTVGFSLNFLAPGRDGDLIAEAWVVQRGGSLTVLDVEVRDESGTKIAKAQVTYKIGLKPRSP